MTSMQLLRVGLALVSSLATVLYLEWRVERLGVVPPRFRPDSGGFAIALVRRTGAATVLAFVLFLGVFGPIAWLGALDSPPSSDYRVSQLFVMHGLLGGALALWYGLGFLPSSGASGRWRRELGLACERPLAEIRLGLVAGVGIWVVVLTLLVLLSALIGLLGGDRALPEQPPSMVLWIGSLPVVARVAVALSAGLAEETFFRGFLQPRVGVLLSTVLFTLAHVSYEQPLMLAGIAILSLFFAYVTRVRGNVWPAIVAHAVFDLVQLLFVVPATARFLEA